MKIEIINADNQYIDIDVESVMSKNTENFLREELKSPECKLKDEINCVLDYVAKLPVFKSIRTLSQLDYALLQSQGVTPLIDTYYSKSHQLDVYGFVKLGRPNAKRPIKQSVDIIEKKDERWGLNIALSLNEKKFQTAYQKIEKHYLFEENRYGKTLLDMLKKTKSMLLKSADLKELDEMSILTGKSDKSAVVIYSPANNGFLNYDGGYSSLLSARIFQSLKVAENTASARKLYAHIFVDVSLDIEGLSISQQYNEEMGALGQIISIKERDAITKHFDSQTPDIAIVNALKDKFPEIYQDLLSDIENKQTTPSKSKTNRI